MSKKQGKKENVAFTESVQLVDSEQLEQEQLEQEKPKALKNISQYRFSIYGKTIQPGAVYVPTDAELQSERDGMRIDNAVRKGYLERV